MTRGPEPCRQRGFSLVELLVALFIIGLLAGVAVLSLPDDRAQLRTEADTLAARAEAARDLAVTGGRPVALLIGPAGHALEQRRDGGWRPLASDRFALVPWRKGTRARFGGSGGAGAQGRVVFDPLGLSASDVQLELAHGSAHAVLRITRSGEVSRDGG